MLLAWGIMLLFTTTSCRDFQDERTPCKSFVEVAFKPKDKHTRLHIIAITEQASNRKWWFREQSSYNLPLNPEADSTTFVIESTAPTSPHTLTITYQRKVSLISHQRGAQLEFVLDQVKVGPNAAKDVKLFNKRLSTFNTIRPDVQIPL